MRYNPDLHHRRSVRARGYDYRKSGLYFVTICTFGRACTLDDLTATLLEQTWRAVGKYNHCARGEDFVVMPNHVHGIVRISRRYPDRRSDAISGAVRAQHVGDPMSAWRQNVDRSFGDGSNADVLRPCVVPGSLGAFVRAFKSASAKRINATRGITSVREMPVWQRGYHERIIRDDAHLAAARQYILDNPAKWIDDPNNPAKFVSPP